MHVTIFNYDKIKGKKKREKNIRVRKEKRTAESAKKREQQSPQL
jgi:hypothetical protein